VLHATAVLHLRLCNCSTMASKMLFLCPPSFVSTCAILMTLHDFHKRWLDASSALFLYYRTQCATALQWHQCQQPIAFCICLKRYMSPGCLDRIVAYFDKYVPPVSPHRQSGNLLIKQCLQCTSSAEVGAHTATTCWLHDFFPTPGTTHFDGGQCIGLLQMHR